jgi:putative DNA primase/helicase
MISAKQSYVMGFDNFSKIDQWLSDALCRLVTGGGFATRQLRTDDTQTIFDAARSIMLNGIDDVAERGDLMERMLVIRCPEFEKGKRRPERYLQHHFDLVYPYLLGALCSVVSKTMAKYAARIDQEKDMRIADFVVWAMAAEEALGYKPGDFRKAYSANQQELRYLALEFSPTITTLIDWKRGRKDANVSYSGYKADWTGTHQELLGALIGPGRNFINVRTSKGLAVEIARAEPALRTIGIVIEHLPREAGTGRRLIRITDTEADQRSNRAKVCDAYRKVHPEFRHESNEKIYKRAVPQPTVTSSQPSQAKSAKA